MNSRYIFLFILMAGIFGCICADQNSELTSNESFKDITDNGVVSVCVQDLETGLRLISFNEQKRLIPASLTKIFTTGAAIECLGNDYRFKTKLFITHSKDDVTQLLIEGGGDPTLGSDRWDQTKETNLFKHIFRELKINGITDIDGGIILDDTWSALIKYPSKRSWEDMGNYYGAPPQGLSYKENSFTLTLASPDSPNKLCTIVKTDPELDRSLVCYVKSFLNEKDSAYIYGHPLMETWYVSGSIPVGRKAFKIKGALPDPGITLAKRLADYLNRNGINVKKTVVKVDDDQVIQKQLLCQIESPDLSDIIKVINKRSNNLFADHLFLQMAKEKDRAVNWDLASVKLDKFWKDRIDGFSGVFYDGSGLSPFNRFSASDMVGALSYLHRTDTNHFFKQSLAVAGSDGTLKNFFKDEEFVGTFVGKSGSMNSVLGYCGYINTRSNKQLAVCVMVNGFDESYVRVREGIGDLLKDIVKNR